MAEAEDKDRSRWRNYILWVLGLLIATVILGLSFDSAVQMAVARVVPEYSYYSDEDAAKIISDYGYTADVATYGAQPLASTANIIIDFMRMDVANNVHEFVEDVFSDAENLLVVVSGIFAILAVRTSSSRKERYIALALTVPAGVLLATFAFDWLFWS